MIVIFLDTIRLTMGHLKDQKKSKTVKRRGANQPPHNVIQQGLSRWGVYFKKPSGWLYLNGLILKYWGICQEGQRYVANIP